MDEEALGVVKPDEDVFSAAGYSKEFAADKSFYGAGFEFFGVPQNDSGERGWGDGLSESLDYGLDFGQFGH